MEKMSSSIIQMLQKWSLLRVSIIILGNLVVFGLGFALGLNYAQNLYLVKKKITPIKDINNKYSDSNIKTNDKYTFFYGLKNSITEKKSNIYKTDGNYQKEYLEEKGLIDKMDLNSKKSILPSDLPVYTIQLYSFKSEDISEKKIKELKKHGFSAYQTKIDLGNNDIYYRVRVGKFKTREEAARVLVKIYESETKEAYITRN